MSPWDVIQIYQTANREYLKLQYFEAASTGPLLTQPLFLMALILVAASAGLLLGRFRRA